MANPEETPLWRRIQAWKNDPKNAAVLADLLSDPDPLTETGFESAMKTLELPGKLRRLEELRRRLLEGEEFDRAEYLALEQELRER